MEPARKRSAEIAGAPRAFGHARADRQLRRHARVAWNVDQVWLDHRTVAHLERGPLPAVFHGEVQRMLLSFERPARGDPARQPPHGP